MHVSSERGVMTVRRNVKRINLHFIPEIDLFSSFSPGSSEFDCQVVRNGLLGSWSWSWSWGLWLHKITTAAAASGFSRELIFWGIRRLNCCEFNKLITAASDHKDLIDCLSLFFPRVARSLSASCNNTNDLIIS